MTASVDAPPKASMLIESMRDIGYSLEMALADVIDNSITAGAKSIQVFVDTADQAVRLGIVDDGKGMDSAELFDAMRLGSRHPLEVRSQRDLGRFGLGMKTASFSQCRRLTVVARRAGKAATAIWDLDHVATTDRWTLLTPDTPDGVPFLDRLGRDGALVVWEKLDRAVEQEGSESARRHFVRRVDEARQHLELVFHRYLTGEPGLTRVKISLNELPLEAFDPFHSSHSATIRAEPEKVQIGEHSVLITAFTLPHHRNVTQAEWERYAGPQGYVKTQGFYLYREKRLIVYGTWFGLARQTELTKLARVRIDMPNALDSAWHVDVKKAWARPPLQVRERLQKIISELGAPSRTVFTRRGARMYDNRLPMWQRVQENNEIVYRLNADNPVIGAFGERLPSEYAHEFDRLLRAVSAGLPMDAIFADLAGHPEAVSVGRITDDELRPMIKLTHAALLESGIQPEVAVRMLRAVEPFRTHWDQTEALLAEIVDREQQ